MRLSRLLASLLAVIAASVAASAQSSWHVVNTMNVGGDGGWDYATVDSQNHRLYVTRSTHTQVIDSSNGKVIADISGQKRSHGVALVPEVGRGFISDGGGDGAIVVFDLKSNAVLGTIPARPDADGIIFDPASNLVLAVSGDEGLLMPLRPDADPKTGKMEPFIELGGKPEFLASDGKGKVYVNLVDKDQVAVVDIAARKVIARWPVAPGGAPVGMAMDAKNHRLFIGCRRPAKLIVMNADDGKVMADFPIGPGVDAAAFDGSQAFASSGGDGTLTVIDAHNDKFALAQTLKTRLGARTMGLDSADHVIYLPTAEFEEAAPGANRRPPMKPGSFMVVVVGH